MKVNKFGTLLKVKYLILLNIFSVFPTPVGMFPFKTVLDDLCSGLPHACGDVPSEAILAMMMRLSSPRMWGCSSASVHALVKAGVFHTLVGMFPSASETS